MSTITALNNRIADLRLPTGTDEQEAIAHKTLSWLTHRKQGGRILRVKRVDGWIKIRFEGEPSLLEFIHDHLRQEPESLAA